MYHIQKLTIESLPFPYKERAILCSMGVIPDKSILDKFFAGMTVCMLYPKSPLVRKYRLAVDTVTEAMYYCYIKKIQESTNNRRSLIAKDCAESIGSRWVSVHRAYKRFASELGSNSVEDMHTMCSDSGIWPYTRWRVYGKGLPALYKNPSPYYLYYSTEGVEVKKTISCLIDLQISFHTQYIEQ